MSCKDDDMPCRRLNAEALKKGWPIRCDPGGVFERKELNDMSALWHEAAAGAVPKRAAIGMRTLKPHARNVAILERVDRAGGHGYRFRLFGSALAIMFGEHTGHSLEEMVQPEILPIWLAFYDAVLQSRRPIRLVNYFRLPSSNFLMGEIFAAPLCDAQGEVNLILAATYVDIDDYAPPPFSPLAQTA